MEKGEYVKMYKIFKDVSYKLLQEGEKIAVLSIGAIATEVSKAIELLKEKGETVPAHYDMVFLKPLDTTLLEHVAAHYQAVVTVEDGAIHGGLGSSVLEFLAEMGYKGRLKRLGIPDQFIPHGTPREQYSFSGIDAQSIAQTILSLKE